MELHFASVFWVFDARALYPACWGVSIGPCCGAAAEKNLWDVEIIFKIDGTYVEHIVVLEVVEQVLGALVVGLENDKII